MGYLLGKNIGGEIALISFRLTWDGCSSLLPFGGVLSFQSEAREASGSETARFHHAARRSGSVATRSARASLSIAADHHGGTVRCRRINRRDRPILAEGLHSELGQPIVVENDGGAGGMTGVNRVAKAAC